MDKDILSFGKIKPDQEFIDEIFSYDVRKLESTDGVVLSQYSIALAQWQIYFKSQINKTKVEIHRNQRIIDGAVNQILNKEILKQYKTKAGASEYIISGSKELNAIKVKIDNFKDELMLLDGVDKSISEFIATLKRELTRREAELYTTRKERYQ